MKYAEVVIGLPIQGPFTYLVPGRLDKLIGIGRRVIVPFGKQRAVGYIVGFTSAPGTKKKIKEIEEIIDRERMITPELLKLTRWIADYYFCAWGEAIEAAIPPILRKGKVVDRSLPIDDIRHTTYDIRKIKSNSLQECASKSIEKSLIQNKKEVFLIQNVGREHRLPIYFKAIEFNLKQGKSSIVLVPEITLVSAVEHQLRLKFGRDAVALMHSRLSPRRLYQEWKKIKTGTSSIVLGTRSAIFAPVKNLKLIVIDAEADPAYKQMEVPRYHAREVALKRAELLSAVVILGSIAPSLESYWLAQAKTYKLIAPQPQKTDLPLKVINMRYEGHGKQKTKPLISKSLESKIEQALTDKQKIILFLNRRGFATFICCPDCKLVLRCPNCSATLKYHFKQRAAVCHQCGYRIAAPEVCPQCNRAYIRYTGSGTERLESEIHRLFPSARALRIDTDSRRVEADCRWQEVDILIGTKAITKIDFNPAPGLIGIISLDNLLNMSDFRGSEHAFQLLIYFANLVKRDGALLVQTYFPESSILKFARQKDCFEFYAEELICRKDLNLPPFKHIAVLTLRDKGEDRLTAQAQKLVSALIKKIPRGMDIVGPLPAAIPKLRGRYQQNIIIKAKNVLSINKFLREPLGGFTKSKIGNIPLTVDIDPL